MILKESDGRRKKVSVGMWTAGEVHMEWIPPEIYVGRTLRKNRRFFQAPQLRQTPHESNNKQRPPLNAALIHRSCVSSSSSTTASFVQRSAALGVAVEGEREMSTIDLSDSPPTLRRGRAVVRKQSSSSLTQESDTDPQREAAAAAARGRWFKAGLAATFVSSARPPASVTAEPLELLLDEDDVHKNNNAPTTTSSTETGTGTGAASPPLVSPTGTVWRIGGADAVAALAAVQLPPSSASADLAATVEPDVGLAAAADLETEFEMRAAAARARWKRSGVVAGIAARLTPPVEPLEFILDEDADTSPTAAAPAPASVEPLEFILDEEDDVGRTAARVQAPAPVAARPRMEPLEFILEDEEDGNNTAARIPVQAPIDSRFLTTRSATVTQSPSSSRSRSRSPHGPHTICISVLDHDRPTHGHGHPTISHGLARTRTARNRPLVVHNEQELVEALAVAAAGGGTPPLRKRTTVMGRSGRTLFRGSTVRKAEPKTEVDAEKDVDWQVSRSLIIPSRSRYLTADSCPLSPLSHSC
ncbi:hypothetical protein BDK51DRAFT_50687 [Blyttiomyces helicus]|uniref:Uncharacterized protein n=1 Tax=Blyttiomyces helicus TaxID=388810 RepID=A0A4P9VV19_9FUNG|nr:hypothetical protein BDK51DRAFT_50687 [Blyttiomyces helicus]|eukprot:RKO83454.1 hypothetical protein BDK51DRAFT_50687 [Blyttiomyces helicus]